ncbi:MAG: SCO family protein [Thermoleophilia bacterium]|nr:SCO family protein [Thermoleophilia bacterium]
MKALVALALGALALSVAGLVLLASRSSGDGYLGTRPPATITLPPFSFTDDVAETVTTDGLVGKVTVITFLDAQCVDACPVVAWELARAAESLTAAERAEVEFLAFSLDPLEDTPEAVDAFLRSRRAKGTLRYLVGPLGEMERVWDAFQVLASADSGDDSLHSVPVRIYGRDGVLRSTLHVASDLSGEALLHDVRLALGDGG